MHLLRETAPLPNRQGALGATAPLGSPLTAELLLYQRALEEAGRGGSDSNPAVSSRIRADMDWIVEGRADYMAP
jgi:hypothetical protein